MKKTRLIPPVHTKTLIEQKADFTAEGSPPPGNVVGSLPPVTPDGVLVADDKPTAPSTAIIGKKQ